MTVPELRTATATYLRAATPRLRERIHEGVEDADHVAALGVLQRMIQNVS
ncbi:hypothetical protein [Actinosynnema pretiosum]|nr:hypothetical protein [Actinosynnema pretiosum]